MEERKVKDIYNQLKEYFQNKPETPNFEEQFSEAIDEMATLIEQFEEKRAALMDTFKGELKNAIDKFNEEKIVKGLEQLHLNNQENEENWRDCEPRMEALAQIKSIFRSNFAAHRRKPMP
jgi:gas vesicle protein